MDALPPEGTSIPDSVLDPLLSISGSPTIEEALEVLVATSRNDDGRSILASRGLLPTVVELIKSLHSSAGHNRHHLLLSLRLLRNLCAGESLNQNMLIHCGGVATVSRAISPSHCCAATDDSFWEVVRAGLQVLANASLAGEEHQRAIWRCFFPTEFLMIAREMRRKEICDPLCKIIYVCVDGNPELFSELCSDPGLAVMAEVIRTASTAGFGEDWIKLLLSRICIEEETCLPGLFSKLNLEPGFTQEQTFLMGLVSEITNEHIKEEIKFDNGFALFILGICRGAAAAAAVDVVNFTIKCLSSLPTGQIAIDMLGYSLAILRAICSMDSSASKDAVDTLVSEGLLDLVLGLLRELEPPSQIRKSMKPQEEEESTTMSKGKLCPYKGFRRDLVSIVGNCAFGRRHVQDEIREKNGIFLMLQQCVLDEDENPFLREWGIWSMRNILENNAANMKLVADLECQGSVDLPEISKAGLRVEVDHQTRRPKLVNISPQ